MFTCFVDFSKAFDKVNYWKLFGKLLTIKLILGLSLFLPSGISIKIVLSDSVVPYLPAFILEMAHGRGVYYPLTFNIDKTVAMVFVPKERR